MVVVLIAVAVETIDKRINKQAGDIPQFNNLSIFV